MNDNVVKKKIMVFWDSKPFFDIISIGYLIGLGFLMMIIDSFYISSSWFAPLGIILIMIVGGIIEILRASYYCKNNIKNLDEEYKSLMKRIKNGTSRHQQ
jgi:pilus assembly protein TadC